MSIIDLVWPFSLLSEVSSRLMLHQENIIISKTKKSKPKQKNKNGMLYGIVYSKGNAKNNKKIKTTKNERLKKKNVFDF